MRCLWAAVVHGCLLKYPEIFDVRLTHDETIRTFTRQLLRPLFRRIQYADS